MVRIAVRPGEKDGNDSNDSERGIAEHVPPTLWPCDGCSQCHRQTERGRSNQRGKPQHQDAPPQAGDYRYSPQASMAVKSVSLKTNPLK